MCIGCESSSLHPWCMECADNYSPVDKWYLIGYSGVWGFHPQTSVPIVEAQQRREAYLMGVADREGEECQ